MVIGVFDPSGRLEIRIWSGYIDGSITYEHIESYFGNIQQT